MACNGDVEVMFDTYAKSGKHDKARRLLSAIAEPQEWHLAKTMEAYLTAGFLPGAEAFLSMLCGDNGNGVPTPVLSTFLFNMIMKAYGKQGETRKAMRWLDRLLACGLRPNRFTFGVLVNACAESGDLQNISKCMDVMKSMQVSMNEVMYNMLIKAHSYKGDVLGAENILTQMVAEGIGVSVVTFNSLMSAYTKAGDVMGAQKVFDRMEEFGVKPNAISYNCVINAHATWGNFEQALSWLKRMSQEGVGTNLVTYSTLCKILASRGEVELIQKVMRAVEDSGERLNEYFYASLLNGCAAKEPVDTVTAELAIQEMNKKKLNVTAVERHLQRIFGNSRTHEIVGMDRDAKRRGGRNKPKASKGGSKRQAHVDHEPAPVAYGTIPTPLQSAEDMRMPMKVKLPVHRISLQDALEKKAPPPVSLFPGTGSVIRPWAPVHVL